MPNRVARAFDAQCIRNVSAQASLHNPNLLPPYMKAFALGVERKLSTPRWLLGEPGKPG